MAFGDIGRKRPLSHSFDSIIKPAAVQPGYAMCRTSQRQFVHLFNRPLHKTFRMAIEMNTLEAYWLARVVRTTRLVIRLYQVTIC